MPYEFIEEPGIEKKPRYVFEEPEVEPEPEPEKPRYVFEEPEVPIELEKIPEAIPEEPKTFLQKLGKGFAMQAQIAPPPESLAQLGAGTIEELTFGAIDVLKPKTPAGEVMREAGKMGIGFPILLQGLGYVLSPLGFLGRILATGTAGGAREAVKEYFKKGEINPKEVAKQGAIWAGIETGIQALGFGLTTKRAIDFISKTTRKSKADVAKFLANKFASRFKKRFRVEPTPTNMERMPPELINETVEETVGDLQKQVRQLEFPKLMEKPPPIKPTEIIKVPETLKAPEVLKAPELPPVEKGIPEINKAKDSMSEALFKDSRIAQKYNNFMNALDVERPFVRAGAAETGFHFKNYFSSINKTVEEGKFTVKKIKKLKLTPEQSYDLVLASEKAFPPKDPKLKEGYTIVRRYFDDLLKNKIASGVLKEGFVENRLLQIKNEIAETQDNLSKAKTTLERRKFGKELNELKTLLDETKDIRFVSIPANLWFNDKVFTDPPLAKRIIKFLTARKRKTATIKSLIDNKVITPEEVNINDIISYDARRSGKDIALGKILQAAKKDGLAFLEPKKDFVKIPGYVAPELAKYYLHPAFANQLANFTQPIPMNWWDRYAQLSKGYRFYNPVFLPIYDLIQQIPILLSNPKMIPKLPKLYQEAILDVIKKRPKYWQAYENGLFSRVTIPQDKTLELYFKNNKIELDTSPSGKLINEILKMPKKIHDKYYAASQAIAWGADEIIRMVSNNIYLEVGMSPREAAQLAANMHADYAKMNPRARRLANRIIFTPTFQALMMRLPLTLAKSGFQIGRAILKGEKIPVKEKKAFQALVGILAGIIATDYGLRKTGWKPEWFGYRYTKMVDGREAVLILSYPFNALLKWSELIYETLLKKGEDRIFFNIMKRLKFKSSSPIQLGWELAENKAPDGRPIIKPGESVSEKALKWTEYIFERTFAMYGDFIKGDRIGDPEANELMDKEFGVLFSKLPIFFAYYRSAPERRKYFKRKQIYNQMLREAKRLRKKGKELSEKEKEKYLKAMREAE